MERTKVFISLLPGLDCTEIRGFGMSHINLYKYPDKDYPDIYRYRWKKGPYNNGGAIVD